MFASILGGLGLKMALLAAVAVAAGGAWLHYQSVVSSRDAALATVGAMVVKVKVQQITIAEQQEAIFEWQASQAQMQTTLDEMAAN